MKLTVLPFQGDEGRTITLCDEASHVIARVTPRNNHERALDEDNFERIAALWNAADGRIIPRLDVAAASAGEWPWYICCLCDTTSAVERDGEWRVYYETIVELLNSHNIEWSGQLIPRMDPPSGDDLASDDEIATAEEMFGGDDLNIADNPEASRGADGTWVQAWVLIPNDDEDEAD